MNAFEVVTVIVCLIALTIATISYVRVNRLMHGRHGRNWFDHREDMAPDEQPSEDDRDAPIPKRPLRGRPN